MGIDLCDVEDSYVMDLSLVQASLWIIIALFSLAGSTGNFDNAFENTIGVDVNVGTVALSFYSGLFAYIGWWDILPRPHAALAIRRDYWYQKRVQGCVVSSL